MREKRLLILITVIIVFAALILILKIQGEIWQGIFTGVFTSAFVALILVVNEYQIQKNQAFKCIFEEILDIQSLLAKHYQEIIQNDELTEELIKKCMFDIPTLFFTQHTLQVILAHKEDQVEKIAHYKSFIDLCNHLTSNGTVKSPDTAATEALAMLSYRIKHLFIGIDLFIKIVENGRWQRVEQAFWQLNFFFDLFKNNILFCFLTRDKEALNKASFSRCSKIESIRKNLWDPIMNMLLSAEHYTTIYFEPFRKGYDLIPLNLLYERYLDLQNTAFFSHWQENIKEKPSKTQYSAFIGGITDQLKLLEKYDVKPHIFGIKAVDFVRRRKNAKNEKEAN